MLSVCFLKVVLPDFAAFFECMQASTKAFGLYVDDGVSVLHLEQETT
jgi:hypothetical protein